MVVKDKSVCSACGRRHWGRCLADIGNCYQCGQEGNMANKCPKGSSLGGRDQHQNAKQENFDKPLQEQDGLCMMTRQKKKKKKLIY